MKRVHFCTTCKIFTLKDRCPKGHKTTIVEPPKYSLTDKYGDYRRKTKIPDLKKKGLI